MKRILVTGASGFVGKRLVSALAQNSWEVVASVRRPQRLDGAAEYLEAPDIEAITLPASLNGAQAIVHLAARVHVMTKSSQSALDEFHRVNVNGTLALARKAAASGIRRFVFISSAKVHGEEGFFKESDPKAPTDAYSLSKVHAEAELEELASKTGMELVIIRPPLVYGPGARANFRALVSLIQRHVPLPLGRVDNRRSLVGLDNLASFVCTCVDHPAAANEAFLVSDGEDLSTAELARRLARAMNRRPILVPVPPGLLRATAKLLGQTGLAQRLLGSLQVDISKAKTALGWIPPVSVDAGLLLAVGSRTV